LLKKAQTQARKQGVEATTILVETTQRDAAGTIVAQARKRRVDLIVLGTHGRRGMLRLVLGSDAEQVVRTAPVPVLLVRA
jgi:nucleotide-binding universal stress UspA family protein